MTNSMSTSDRFEAFEAAPFPFNRMSRIRSRWFLLLFPALLAPIAVICLFEGTLGNGSDVPKMFTDFLRAFNSHHRDGHAQGESYPLLRDLPTLLLVTLLVVNTSIMHRQWCLFDDLLGILRRNGVLRLRSTTLAAPSWERFLKRINSALRFFGSALGAIVILGLALLLSGILSWLAKETGVFRVLYQSMSKADASAAAEATYQRYWAGDSHPVGYWSHIVLGAILIYTSLLQNAVGLPAAYVVLSLRRFFVFGVDWADADGSFGWLSLGLAFRTVRWSLFIHGLALSVLAISFGPGVLVYGCVLYAIWLAALVFYIFCPWLVFRRVRREANAEAGRRLAPLLEPGRSAELFGIGLAGMESARRAPISPLRTTRLGIYPFAASIVLPLALFAVQIVLA